MRAPYRIAFLPLLDCAPLVAAKEKGFFAAQGAPVELRKAQSWSQLRDWLVTGQVDAAQMLLTIPIQCAVGPAASPQPLAFAYTLNRRGNGVIFGNALWNAGARDARGLAAYLDSRHGEIVRMGVVFPRGTQEYFLRYWLAEAGLVIGDRISLAIIPPQELVGRLRKREVEGFCVAEPWSLRATASKLGRLVAESGNVLPGLGDKVLAVRSSWHSAHAAPHACLLRALAQADAWLEDAANGDEAAEMLASKRYVNTSRSVVKSALAGAQAVRAAAGPGAALDRPHRPARAHVQWYLRQMFRWRHLPEDASPPDPAALCLEEFHDSALAGAI